MSYEAVPKARYVRAVGVFVLLGALVAPLVAKADPSAPLNVLFVANGWCSQEDDIENHFLDLGYNVTRMKDYQVRGATDFSGYDLIVLTESAPLVSAAGLDAIKASGKPVLVVESWTFLYAYRLGLTTSPLARLSYGDTVTSLMEGYTAFTSRVGAEALVYQPGALAFGVSPAHVKQGVVPLYQTSGYLPGVTIFIDYEKKIAVTGIPQTEKFTVDAWKILDILVEQIEPDPPERETMQEVAQAYFDSGLPSFIAQVKRDLRERPGSWTLDEVEREAWALTVEWRLDELRDYIAYQVYDIFDVELPVLAFPIYSPPERPHGDGTNWLPDMGEFVDEHEHWFLGQYWDPATDLPVNDAFFWSQYHTGTDLGLGANAELNGRQYFYMGDTWDISPGVHKWSEKKCDVGAGVRCDDMIVISGDDDPSDGIVAMPALNYEHEVDGWRWTPVVIQGVHREFSPQLQDAESGLQYWINEDEEPTYTAPTGAFVSYLPFSVLGVPDAIGYLPVLVLAYGTATQPSAALDGSDPQTRPMSWMGCSFNGTTFRACYRDAADDAVPFSADIAPSGAAEEGGPGDPGEPAKFIQIAAVYLAESDFAGMCTGAATDTEICEFADSGGGVLLYGSGRPYRKSGLYLAFIPRGDFGQLGLWGRPIVRYWTGDGWSSFVSDAVSLTHHGTDAPPCDDWPEPDYDYTAPDANPFGGCWPELQGWSTRPVFGEISARLIRAETGPLDSKIILLGSNDWSFLSLKTDPRYNDLRMVFAWRAPLASPWAGDYGTDDYPDLSPVTTNTAGYGPYIIDAYSNNTYPGSDPTGQTVTLWHTISVWQGPDSYTPYGTYTGSEAIPW